MDFVKLRVLRIHIKLVDQSYLISTKLVLEDGMRENCEFCFYFLQTLVSSEPPSTGRPCFKWTVKELLQLALMEDTVSGTPSNSKVWYKYSSIQSNVVLTTSQVKGYSYITLKIHVLI